MTEASDAFFDACKMEAEMEIISEQRLEDDVDAELDFYALSEARLQKAFKQNLRLNKSQGTQGRAHAKLLAEASRGDMTAQFFLDDIQKESKIRHRRWRKAEKWGKR